MELEYKAEVLDRNGENLGTVDHYVRDTWSGEISKFVVRREAPQADLFVSPADVADSSRENVKLKVTLAGLEKR
jgi:hypothetical protein